MKPQRVSTTCLKGPAAAGRVALLLLLGGCHLPFSPLTYPVYREPGGFSSSYHRQLFRVEHPGLSAGPPAHRQQHPAGPAGQERLVPRPAGEGSSAKRLERGPHL